jgi:hypothetical protein
MARMSGVGQLTTRGIWEAGRLARRLGVVGLAGSMFLAAALVLGAYARNMSAKQVEIVKQVEQARQMLTRAPLQPVAEDPEEKLAAFYAYLLPHDDIPEQVKRLINLSEKENVSLFQGEYKAQREAGAGFLRFRIILPIKGDYGAIQSFMLRALKENKTLALESVAFRRERIEAREVEARIQFVLFTREPQTAVGGAR